MPMRIIVPCVYAVAIGMGALLLVQHWLHVPQFLPYLFFLVCPLMHLFMHHGHRAHARQEKPKQTPEPQ